MITIGTEREVIEGWLDEHRRALLWKCRGLTDEQLRQAADPPSTLTLLGLLRHMADNERWWFSRWAAQGDPGDLYSSEDPGGDPDGDHARHNGHADLLREHLDGATGDFPDRT